MGSPSYILLNAVHTLLRMFPFPCKTGILRIGHPGQTSPVFLTCNYHLTVERVKHALRDVDCYLLVANSRGVNVWCAATGGLLTHHDVISALKTSGIEDLVVHRQVILPQLAATGIEARTVQTRAGWRVLWGPVYAEDIPAFLENRRLKTPEMRQVSFHRLQRLEMAAAWAFPISLVAALALLPWWRGAILPLTALIWGLSLALFGLYPLYDRWLGGQRHPSRLSFLRRGGLQILLWGLCLLGIGACSLFSGGLPWGTALRWGGATLVVVLVLTVDLTGSTPVLKSGLHPDRAFRVTLDASRCRGAGACEHVCPRDCFRVDRMGHTTALTGTERCVQCGACIVQCPYDALSFTGPAGEWVPPETVRRYKLNLMGKRGIKPGTEK